MVTPMDSEYVAVRLAADIESDVTSGQPVICYNVFDVSLQSVEESFVHSTH